MGKKLSFLLILTIGLLSSGAILKKRDSIRDTQTDPVAYQAKLKEQREGKKGPPVPSFEFFPKQRFLVQSPVEKPKPSSLSGNEREQDQAEPSDQEEKWEWQDIKEEDKKDDREGD